MHRASARNTSFDKLRTNGGGALLDYARSERMWEFELINLNRSS